MLVFQDPIPDKYATIAESITASLIFPEWTNASRAALTMAELVSSLDHDLQLIEFRRREKGVVIQSGFDGGVKVVDCRVMAAGGAEVTGTDRRIAAVTRLAGEVLP